jgi:hypothetical protein
MGRVRWRTSRINNCKYHMNLPTKTNMASTYLRRCSEKLVREKSETGFPVPAEAGNMNIP